MGTHRIFSRGGQIRGPGVFIPSINEALMVVWGQSPQKPTNVLNIMHFTVITNASIQNTLQLFQGGASSPLAHACGHPSLWTQPVSDEPHGHPRSSSWLG